MDFSGSGKVVAVGNILKSLLGRTVKLAEGRLFPGVWLCRSTMTSKPTTGIRAFKTPRISEMCRLHPRCAWETCGASLCDMRGFWEIVLAFPSLQPTTKT